MTAEEMFNKLGYEKNYQELDNEIYIYYKKNGESYSIKFINKNKIIINDNDEFITEWDTFILSIDLLEAIMKQIEELGWDK